MKTSKYTAKYLEQTELEKKEFFVWERIEQLKLLDKVSKEADEIRREVQYYNERN